MAVKYVPYFKEPIEGQAILDNFMEYSSRSCFLYHV